MAGTIHLPLPVVEALLCALFCECLAEAQAKKFETAVDPMAFDGPNLGVDPSQKPGRSAYQACVERKFNKEYKNTNVRAEQSYDTTKTPPQPIPTRAPGSSRPDFIALLNPAGPATAPNIKVFEMKFPGDRWQDGQKEAYTDIGGGDEPKELNKQSCKC